MKRRAWLPKVAVRVSHLSVYLSSLDGRAPAKAAAEKDVW